jgi:hypothetical protein
MQATNKHHPAIVLHSGKTYSSKPAPALFVIGLEVSKFENVSTLQNQFYFI